MLHSALINVMVKAARRAGRSLKRDLGEIEHLQVSLKGPANFVSLADKRAEEMLYEDLAKARPGYGFIGEEGGTREGTDASHTWIVDPLDGTTNFLHGIPQFAISIGLQPIGLLVGGALIDRIGGSTTMALMGLTIALVSLAFVPVRAIRRGTVLLEPRQEIAADFVLLMTGYRQDPTLFEMLGVELEGEGRFPVHDAETMETNVPGVFAVAFSWVAPRAVP